MADQKLTDKPELVGKSEIGDWIHVVDVSDTTSDPNGSSKKQRPLNFLIGKSFIPILGALVWKFGSNEQIDRFQTGDWVIYMNETEDRLVIGIALSEITAIGSIDTGSSFKKFFEGNSLLP